MWINEGEFSTRVNPDDFISQIEYIRGIILHPNEQFLKTYSQEVNEPQFGQQAWRWFGVHNETPFHLDVAASDHRNVLPFSFWLYYDRDIRPSWKAAATWLPVLKTIGSLRIDRIPVDSASGEFCVFRKLPGLGAGDTACVVFSTDTLSNAKSLCDFLRSEWDDQELYIGRRVS
ncbi:MAG: hypothetical protein KDA58_00415 [Planctomycetaceae bacterium]|nr:hypothetical protein [Planctomycetaceae bacterium]